MPNEPIYGTISSLANSRFATTHLLATSMEFFGRTEELHELHQIRDRSRESARFTVITGRRRIGKTELVTRAFNDGVTPCLYFLVTRKPEKTQCTTFQEEAEKVLGIHIAGHCERFKEVLDAVFSEAVRRPLTLIIDEFQEFDRVEPGIFGDVQSIWDSYHTRAKINLVVCGSINRLINKIFFNDAEPLYGRNTGKLELKPFKVSLLKTILAHYSPSYTNEDLLALWTISGGIARYVDLLMTNRAYTREKMLKTVFGQTTAFIDEGKVILIEEFGKDYGVYFAILSAIASGKTTSAEIRNELGVEVGGYLTKLEESYSLITKKQPLFEKTNNKGCHYQIDDCFFRFWFRFIFKYQYLIELGRYEELRALVDRDFHVFAGYALERYFTWKTIEDTRCTRLGGWWDRKGENEIDLVIEDEFAGTLDFREIKIDPARFNAASLDAKVTTFLAKNPTKKSLRQTRGCLSLNDM